MQMVNVFTNFMLGTMSGITILGLSSNALFGVTGAVTIFFFIMMLDIANPFTHKY